MLQQCGAGDRVEDRPSQQWSCHRKIQEVYVWLECERTLKKAAGRGLGVISPRLCQPWMCPWPRVLTVLHVSAIHYEEVLILRFQINYQSK